MFYCSTERNIQVESLPTIRESNPLSLISQAIDSKVDINTLERLFELQERWERNNAKKAFDSALAEFQYRCPLIPKTKPSRDKNGRILYRYAPIEVIVKYVKPLLYEVGFSYMFRNTDNYEIKSVTVETTLRHRDGHSETLPYTVPYITQTGIMSDAHQVEGTFTLAQRKGLSAILGIVTEDDKNGDFRDKPELIDEEQIATIKELCLEKGIDVSKAILVPNKVDSLQQLTAEQASSIITKLQAAKSKKPVEPDDIPY
jgi:hypothetical protein